MKIASTLLVTALATFSGVHGVNPVAGVSEASITPAVVVFCEDLEQPHLMRFPVKMSPHWFGCYFTLIQNNPGVVEVSDDLVLLPRKRARSTWLAFPFPILAADM